MEEEVELPVDKDVCSGCQRRADDGEEFSRCSRCRQAYYCSRNCQVNDWSTHKAKCNRTVEVKKLAAEGDQKRELRLLQEWKRQVKNGGILGYMLLNFFGWNILSRMEQEKSMVMLHLVFDYNKRNFVPESEPSIGSINEAGQFSNDLEQVFASFPSHGANKINMVVCITVEGMKICSCRSIAIERPQGAMTRGTWRELQELLNDVTLQSSKFATWPGLLQQNLRKCLNLVRENAHFQPFLTNALWVESAKGRHMTHIVTVDMELGYELGQVKRLESYSVKPIAEVSSLMAQAGLLSPEIQQMLDLKNNPQLLQSRKQYPNNHLLPVLFYCSRTKVCIMIPNLIEISPTHATYPIKQCDKKAKVAFQKLQKIRFPTVQSPDLH